MEILRSKFERILSTCDTTPFEVVYWDGGRARFGQGPPEFTLHFRTRASVRRTLADSSLGLGESYVDGTLLVEGDLEDALTTLSRAYLRLPPEGLLSRWLHHAMGRSRRREKADIEHHYGLGNDFYRFYLDKNLQYSCAYFRSPQDSLDEAQARKIEYTTRKLDLHPGQRLIDIGCGWGHLMLHAARTYGVRCLGITLCENQAAYVRERAAALRLPVDVRVMNYQELDDIEPWDRIVSVGMMEHVGERRMDVFHDKVNTLLAPGGVCLLHSIAKMRESPGVDPFVERHVFPGYWFGSLEGMTSRVVRRHLNVMDVENLRRHYALTAHHWRRNFLANYEAIKRRFGFDGRFMRTWEFYLALVVAGFRSGHLNLIQMVMSKGVTDQYPWTRDFLYAPRLLELPKKEAC